MPRSSSSADDSANDVDDDQGASGRRTTPSPSSTAAADATTATTTPGSRVLNLIRRASKTSPTDVLQRVWRNHAATATAAMPSSSSNSSPPAERSRGEKRRREAGRREAGHDAAAAATARAGDGDDEKEDEGEEEVPSSVPPSDNCCRADAEEDGANDGGGANDEDAEDEEDDDEEPLDSMPLLSCDDNLGLLDVHGEEKEEKEEEQQVAAPSTAVGDDGCDDNVAADAAVHHCNDEDDDDGAASPPDRAAKGTAARAAPSSCTSVPATAMTAASATTAGDDDDDKKREDEKTSRPRNKAPASSSSSSSVRFHSSTSYGQRQREKADDKAAMNDRDDEDAAAAALDPAAAQVGDRAAVTGGDGGGGGGPSVGAAGAAALAGFFTPASQENNTDDVGGDEEGRNKGEKKESDEKKEELVCDTTANAPTDDEDNRDGAIKGDGTKDDNEDEDETKRINSVLLTCHTKLTDLGNALRCPICQHTLNDPALLPCVHAFCRSCITTALTPSPVSDHRRKRKKDRSGGNNKSPKVRHDRCPICKLKCSRRAIVPSPHLAQLAEGYKKALRAFGMTPVVPDASVEMTQLFPPGDLTAASQDDDTEGHSQERSQDGDDDDGWHHPSPKKRRKVKVHPAPVEVNEHKTVANLMHRALMTRVAETEQQAAAAAVGKDDTLASATNGDSDAAGSWGRAKATTTTTTKTTDAPFSSRAAAAAAASAASGNTAANSSSFTTTNGKARRIMAMRSHAAAAAANAYRKLAEDQNRVVKADERALVRASTRKFKEIQKAKEAAKAKKKAQEEEEEERERERQRMHGEEEEEQKEEKEMVGAATSSSMAAAKKSADDDDDAAAAPPMSCDSPLVLHDGHTILQDNGDEDPATSAAGLRLGRAILNKDEKKAAKETAKENEVFVPPPTQEVMNDALEREAADRSGEWMLDEIEREEEKEKEQRERQQQQQGSGESGQCKADAVTDDRAVEEAAAMNGDDGSRIVGAEAETGTNDSATTLEDDTVSNMDDGERKEEEARAPPSESSGANTENAVLALSSMAHASPDAASLRVVDDDAMEEREEKVPAAEAKDDGDAVSARAAPAVAASADEDEPSFPVADDESSGLDNDAGDATEQAAEPEPAQVQNPSPAATGTSGTAAASSTSREEEGHAAQPTKTSAATPPTSTKAPFAIGTIVRVESRTWPGVNKPGGVARIAKVHDDAQAAGIKYDVAYVLGGREKGVDWTFVRAHEDGQEDFASPVKNDRGRNSVTVAAAEKKGSIGKRRAPSRRSRRGGKENDIPPEVLAWANKKSPPAPKSGKATKSKKKKARTDSEVTAEKTNAADASQNVPEKKRGSSGRSANPKRRKKAVATEEAVVGGKTCEEEKADKSATEGNGEVAAALPTSNLTDAEARRLAEERYRTVLFGSSAQPDGTSTPKGPIYVVTSSLSDYDKNMVQVFISEMKSLGVVVKVSKDFHPEKTCLCITPSAPSFSLRDTEGEDQSSFVTSKFRTLKTMRAALAAIPIVTPAWITACLEQKRVLSPTGNMCITTMPTKREELLLSGSGDRPTARFGVARYAARMRLASTLDTANGQAKMLRGVLVHLCGPWSKGPKKKDVQILLRESGALIATSAGMTSKKLKALKARDGTTGKVHGEEDNEETVVLLCDDSSTDQLCGISANLHKDARGAIGLTSKNPGRDNRVFIVNSSWLFDCISCGMFLNGDNYEPASPKAKSLWKMCATA